MPLVRVAIFALAKGITEGFISYDVTCPLLPMFLKIALVNMPEPRPASITQSPS